MEDQFNKALRANQARGAERAQQRSEARGPRETKAPFDSESAAVDFQAALFEAVAEYFQDESFIIQSYEVLSRRRLSREEAQEAVDEPLYDADASAEAASAWYAEERERIETERAAALARIGRGQRARGSRADIKERVRAEIAAGTRKKGTLTKETDRRWNISQRARKNADVRLDARRSETTARFDQLLSKAAAAAFGKDGQPRARFRKYIDLFDYTCRVTVRLSRDVRIVTVSFTAGPE